MLLALARQPLLDVDLYWHIRAGQELLDGVAANRVGQTWSFAPDPLPWVTTQWLAEVLFALLHRVGGWDALIAFRTLTTAAVLAILARATLARRPVVLAAIPYLVAGASAVAVANERPQQVTLIAAALLGAVLRRGLVEGRLPRWWVFLPSMVLWANLHGGWVLGPAVLGLVGLARMFDHGVREPVAWRAFMLAAGSLVAGILTPAGIGGVTAVTRFSDAAAAISEWAPTAPMSDIGYLTVAMLLAIGVAWARPGAVPRSEVLVTLVLLLLAWSAWRYVTPALLLMAPLVAHRLVLAFPRIGERPEPSWSRPAGVAAAGALLMAGVLTIPTREPLPTAEWPIGLAQQIAELEPGQDVLNDYNTAGIVLFFGGQDSRVGIDGRTDRYGAQYIADYIDLTDLKGDWKALLDELDPTSALLEEDSPLAYYLTESQGWSVAGQESGFTLLVKPT